MNKMSHLYTIAISDSLHSVRCWSHRFFGEGIVGTRIVCIETKAQSVGNCAVDVIVIVSSFGTTLCASDQSARSKKRGIVWIDAHNTTQRMPFPLEKSVSSLDGISIGEQRSLCRRNGPNVAQTLHNNKAIILWLNIRIIEIL